MMHWDIYLNSLNLSKISYQIVTNLMWKLDEKIAYKKCGRFLKKIGFVQNGTLLLILCVICKLLDIDANVHPNVKVAAPHAAFSRYSQKATGFPQTVPWTGVIR